MGEPLAAMREWSDQLNGLRCVRPTHHAQIHKTVFFGCPRAKAARSKEVVANEIGVGWNVFRVLSSHRKVERPY